MRVGAVRAVGEFGHVSAAEDDGTGRAQARNGGRISRRSGCLAQNFRARARDIALNVEKILDRNRDAGERRGHVARGAHRVAGARSGNGRVRVDFDEGARTFSGGIGNFLQTRTHQFFGRGGTEGEVAR